MRAHNTITSRIDEFHAHLDRETLHAEPPAHIKMGLPRLVDRVGPPVKSTSFGRRHVPRAGQHDAHLRGSSRRRRPEDHGDSLGITETTAVPLTRRDPDAVREQLKIEQETTPGIVRWPRVASKAPQHLKTPRAHVVVAGRRIFFVRRFQ